MAAQNRTGVVPASVASKNPNMRAFTPKSPPALYRRMLSYGYIATTLKAWGQGWVEMKVLDRETKEPRGLRWLRYSEAYGYEVRREPPCDSP